MAVDKFLGITTGDPTWFDGNPHSWHTVSGGTSSAVWDCGAPITVTSLFIQWHYGGAYNRDGSPGPAAGAAADFTIEGSANGTTGWTTVVTDADPVGTAGASYPGDFEHTYSFAVVTWRYWRFRSTTVDNNDLYTISAFGPVAPIPGIIIDWDDDGFEDGDYDQLPLGHVARWLIQRGASAEITGGATIGSLELEINNPQDTDLYNPLNASGPLYGLLRDGRPIWIGVNSDGALIGDSPRGLFGGRVTDITPQPVPGATHSPTVIIQAEDALGWYDRVPVRLPDSLSRSHDSLRAEMLDEANETRIDLAHEILTMPLSSWDGSLLDGLEAINKVNGTRHFCKPENLYTDWYTYTTRNRQWRLDGTVDASLDGAADALSTDGWRLSADTVTNQQKATVNPISFTPSPTIVWEAEGLPWTVRSTADKVIWVEFDDFVDSPVVSTNHTGTAPTVTLLPFGSTAKLTIHTSGTTVITSAVITGALAKRGNAVSAIEDDTASQAGTRGVRAGSEISGDFVGVLANAQGIAAHIVWRYAEPQFRPTATVINWIPEQFDIDLYDIVSVTVAELQMTTRHFEVVGLTHEGLWAAGGTVDGNPKHLHTTTYVLQECAVQSDPGWFVLDTSELDSADILAY